MATTSPDNIKSPDAGDQYALVQDLGALADTVQNALTKRGNAYVGSVAQRQAFTTAPIGTLWQDNSGSNMWLWVRKSTGWVVVNPSAVGSVTTASVPTGKTVDTAVSFPSGLFSTPPRVTLQTLSAHSAARNVTLRPTSVSTSGFTLSAYNFDPKAYAATVAWTAVQGS